jgi:hypothetical protein
MPHVRTLLVVLVVTLSSVAVSCSAPPRNPVPELRVADARVKGFEDIFVRFDGDDDTPEMTQWLRESFDRERVRLRASGSSQLPPAQFLAISGGGQDGAYGAGLLCGWTAAGNRPEFRVVTGVSTGALIAPFAFLGPEYDHVLRDVYTNVSTRDILRRRGLIGGLLGDAMTDTTPLRELLARHVTQEFLDKVAAEYRNGRLLIVATTNLDSQKPVMWALGALAASGRPGSLELFRDIMLASASIPGVFPPVQISVVENGEEFEELHVDGGTTSQVFLYPGEFSLAEFSREFGLQRDRTVFVIRNGSPRAQYEVIPRRTLPIAARAISTLIKTQGVGDLYRIYLGCQRDGIAYRLAYIPEDFRENPTEPFDPVYMQKLFDLGFARASGGYPWSSAPPGFGSVGGQPERVNE